MQTFRLYAHTQFIQERVFRLYEWSLGARMHARKSFHIHSDLCDKSNSDNNKIKKKHILYKHRLEYSHSMGYTL